MATKEVYYYKYCKLCKYYDTDETEDPCNDCLDNPSNEDTHKPTGYKRDDKYTEEDEKKAH